MWYDAWYGETLATTPLYQKMVLTPLWNAISERLNQRTAAFKAIDNKLEKDPENEDLDDACLQQKAAIEEKTEFDICELAGIPYQGWAYYVRECAFERNDHQTIDLMDEIRLLDHMQLNSYSLLMQAFVGICIGIRNAYSELMAIDLCEIFED